MHKPLVIISGPTAVGKTSLSIQLAHRINGAIISADSMQVYKYMDIGSAKITPEQMQGVTHYLIDCLLPEEEFHVVRFVKMAKAALDEIYQQGKIPIVVGGTGFYIQALLYDIDFDKEPTDGEYRRQLEELAQKDGADALYEMLCKIDPESAMIIHKNNVKRVIRALEFYHDNGKKISQHNKEQREKKSPYQYGFYVLTDERSLLYERIDQRVDQMMNEGLLDEVIGLKQRGYYKEMVSMQGLGYKELLSYLDHEVTLEEAVYMIKRDTRHFAKRQLTWFKREKDAIFLNRQDFQQSTEKMLEYMISDLINKKIIQTKM